MTSKRIQTAISHINSVYTKGSLQLMMGAFSLKDCTAVCIVAPSLGQAESAAKPPVIQTLPLAAAAAIRMCFPFCVNSYMNIFLGGVSTSPRVVCRWGCCCTCTFCRMRGKANDLCMSELHCRTTQAPAKEAITLRRTVLPGGTSSCCTAARSPKPLMSETCNGRHGTLLDDQQVGVGWETAAIGAAFAVAGSVLARHT